MEPAPLRKILSDKKFKKIFGVLKGEQLKTAPKGFDKQDPAVDLLRYKQFIISHKFADTDITSNEFHLRMIDVFVAMRPFLDYMTDILITDLNGIAKDE